MLSLRHIVGVGVLCVPLFTQAALADDFQNRLNAANFISASPSGSSYVQTFSAVVQSSIQFCIPAKDNSPATLGKFIFVASVTKAGVVMSGDVQPRTAVSQCFAVQFAQNKLMPPPIPPNANANYPIAIEMNVAP